MATTFPSRQLKGVTVRSIGSILDDATIGLLQPLQALAEHQPDAREPVQWGLVAQDLHHDALKRHGRIRTKRYSHVT